MHILKIDFRRAHAEYRALPNARAGCMGAADPGKALNYNISYVDYLGLPINDDARARALAALEAESAAAEA